jgi:hypothetical protein
MPRTLAALHRALALASAVAFLSLPGCGSLTDPEDRAFTLSATGDQTFSLSGTGHYDVVPTDIGPTYSITLDDDSQKTTRRFQIRVFAAQPEVATYDIRVFAPRRGEQLPLNVAFYTSDFALNYIGVGGTVRITDVSGGRVRGEIDARLAAVRAGGPAMSAAYGANGELVSATIPPATLTIAGTFDVKR